MKKYLVLLCGFALITVCATVSAQSNDQVDALLAQQRATVDQAAYLALTAGGKIDETATPADAYAYLVEKGWISAKRPADSLVRLDEFSLIVMKSLDLRGGVMYSFFPCNRYAYRELVYLDVVNSTGGSSRFISGEEVVTIVHDALEMKGGSL